MLNTYSLTKAKQNFGLTYPENENSLIKTIRRKTKGEPDWLVGISNNLISEKLTADRSNDINAIEKANSRLESFNIDLDGFNEMTSERKNQQHIVDFTKERYKPIDDWSKKNNSFNDDEFETSWKNKNVDVMLGKWQKINRDDIFKTKKDSEPKIVLMSNNINSSTQNSSNFDYNTRLSYNQTYDKRVEILQKKLSDLGYLDMSRGGWGYYGNNTINAVNRYKKDKGLGNTGNDYGVVGKQTWNSLGLLCREQVDIDSGVKIVTLGSKQYYDMTDAIKNALKLAKPQFEKVSKENIWNKYKYFIGEVCNTGTWNLKYNYGETWTKTLNVSLNTYSANDGKFLFNGHIYTAEDIGNITYGYLGTAAGISEKMLMNGSLAYHAKNHLGVDFFEGLKNEYNDEQLIQQGIDMYNGINTEARFS